jgi:chromosomal replication initiator protein
LPSFVVGTENRLVASAVARLMPERETSATNRPTLLVLYGPSGCGKTHLSRGLVRIWQDRYGQECAAYFTAGDLRREFAAAMDVDQVCEFRQRIRSPQVLAIDDLHQLPDEPCLLQELRYALDEYGQNGRIVIVTSARPTSTLSNISADVRSRMAAGLVLQLAPPGTAARKQIVLQTVAALGRRFSGDVAARLAAGVPGSANDLFGAVFELCAITPLSSDEVQNTDRLLASRAVRQPTLREIIAVVAKFYKQPQAVLKSASRRQSAVLPRAVIVYLARELADHSYHEIGRALGGRDHSTIMHNYRKVQSTRQHDLAIQNDLDEVTRILLSG